MSSSCKDRKVLYYRLSIARVYDKGLSRRVIVEQPDIVIGESGNGLDIQHGIAFQSGENTVESIQLFKGLRPEQPTARYCGEAAP